MERMKQRLLAALLSAAIACSWCMPVSAASCRHKNVNAEVITEATCTEDGELASEGVCADCGETVTIKKTTIKKLGHNYKKQDPNYPDNPKKTVTNMGWDEYGHWQECTRCGESKSVSAHKFKGKDCALEAECTDKNCGYVKEASVHLWGKAKVTKKVTCVEDGTQTYTCADKACKETDDVTVEAHGDPIIEIPGEPATCTENGKTAKIICSTCGKVAQKQKTIKKGHTYQTQRDAFGHWDVCIRCGDTKTVSAHKYSVKDCEKADVCKTCGYEKDTETHLWGKAKATRKVTCVEDGIQTYTCADKTCKETHDVIIEAHGEEIENPEKPEIPATCTKAGKTAEKICSTCGKVVVKQKTTKKLGHDEQMKFDADGHWKECVRCGDAGKKTAHKLTADKSGCQNCDWREMKEGACGENLTWTLEGGVLTISGEGAMDTGTNGKSPWYDEREEITKIVIKEGITATSAKAFGHCVNLTEVVLPDTLTRLGEFTFFDCRSLTEIDLPPKLIAIDESAFFSCENLKQITIPEGITSLEFGVLMNCKSLERLDLPRSLTDLNASALVGCRSLSNIYYAGSPADWSEIRIDEDRDSMPDVTIHCGLLSDASGTCGPKAKWELKKGVLTISGSGSFYHWGEPREVDWYLYRGEIETIVIKEGITAIGEYAFYGCSNLTDVTIPNTVTEIDYRAFAKCSSLTEIDLPDSVTEIDGSAFLDCLVTGIVYRGECGYEARYTLKDGVLTISGNGPMDDWDSADDVAWYEQREDIRTVVIETDITGVGYDAFAGCTNLTDVTIPEGVTYLEQRAFRNCTSLTEISLPKSLTSIAVYVFSGCTLSDVYYAGSEEEWQSLCTWIGNGNETLLDAEIHFAVEEPEEPSCPSVTNIRFVAEDGRKMSLVWDVDDAGLDLEYQVELSQDNGASWTNLPRSGDQWRLDTVAQLPSGVYNKIRVTVRDNRGEMADSETEAETALFLTEKTDDLESLLWSYDEASGTYSIKISGLEPYTHYMLGNRTDNRFGSDAFYTDEDGCGEVTGRTYDVRERQFLVWKCSDALIYDGIAVMSRTQYGDWTYPQDPPPDVVAGGTCGENLIWTLMNHELTIFGTGPMTDYSDYDAPWYEYREDITSVVIQEGVTSIGSCAFMECGKLTGVDIPDSVTFIGAYAFYECHKLKAIDLPDSITEIGRAVFVRCGLESIRIPAGVTVISEDLFLECFALKSVEFHGNVTSIGCRAFTGCSSLTDVNLPDSITSLGSNVFSYCTGLKRVVLPKQLEYLASHNFVGCTALTEITIPTGVTYLGWNTFGGCTSLTDIYYDGCRMQWDQVSIGEHDGIDPSQWTIHYGKVDSGTCGENVTWTLLDGVLTISGEGAMTDYENGDFTTEIVVPWDKYRDEVTSVIIEEGVTAIGAYAFRDHENLASVTIPDSVTSIGEYAFDDCICLKSIDLHDGIVEMGEGAFAGSGLEHVKIPAGVTRISEVLFSGCPDLKSVEFHENVTFIEQWAFRASGLTEINLPESVTRIDGGAFEDCTELTEATLPASVTEMGGAMFAYCTGLKRFVFPEGMEKIPARIFEGCTALTEVVIPASVIVIWNGAFGGCDNLTDIYYGGSSYQWDHLYKYGIDTSGWKVHYGVE